MKYKSIKKEYIDVPLTHSNLDIFIVRTSIFNALKKVAPQLSGCLLDVGCGYMPYKSFLLSTNLQIKEYIGLDIHDNIYQNTDLEWDGQTIPLTDQSVDCAIATELLEHCPNPELVLKEICRVLKPNGIIFLTVPYLWPLHCIPNDEYRYTPFSIHRHLLDSGFKDIKIQALGGWDASLAQMIGLWVKRRLSGKKKRILSLIALPIISLLLQIDKPVQRIEDFQESSMLTGLAANATKGN
jgi:SAM-dependent methyltransferase